MPKNMERFAPQYRKGASRLKKCGKQLRAAENFETTVEGQRLLLANIMEDTRLQISPFKKKFRKLSDTKHVRSNHAKDLDWESCGNRKQSTVFNALPFVTGNILLISSSWST